MAFNWRELIGTVAPTLATALTGGNPLAGIAVKAISNQLLGKPDGTEEDIITLMAGATPETLKELKKVEADFKTKMKELGIETHKLNVKDRADAREKEERTGDKTPMVLAGVSILGFFLFLYVILEGGLPQEAGAKEIILILAGILGGLITQVFNYYFGSSKGSSDKTKLLGKVNGSS